MEMSADMSSEDPATPMLRFAADNKSSVNLETVILAILNQIQTGVISGGTQKKTHDTAISFSTPAR